MNVGERLRQQDRLCFVWPKETILSRLQRCRIMLALHECLTDADNEKVKARIASLANDEQST